MKNFKTFIIGLVCGAMIMSAPALANGVKQLIEAELNTINITVNGEKVDAENILYNDRTYVPLRKVAEMLGKYVSWDEATNTAGINDTAQGTDFSVKFDGDVIGMVGDKEIYQSQLDMYIKNAKAENENITDADAIKLAKETIAYDEAIILMAKNNGITINKEFKELFDNYITQMDAQYGAENAFEHLLSTFGYTMESYQRTQEIGYLEVKLGEVYLEKYSPSDEQIKAYYDQNKDEFYYDGLVAKHILLSTTNQDGSKMTEAQINAVEKEATNLYNKLIKGEDFDKLMKEFGEDPGVAQNPDGYMFTKGDMVEEFEKTAYELKVGEISKPVKSSFGYHIIKLMEKVEYLPLDNENVINYIKTQIVGEILRNDIVKNTIAFKEV